ncbi:hypothetical protein L1887_62654 [Cichorium endivia]|nr:hypothetical protein L1887_62654 [Cichorium endivia]
MPSKMRSSTLSTTNAGRMRNGSTGAWPLELTVMRTERRSTVFRMAPRSPIEPVLGAKTALMSAVSRDQPELVSSRGIVAEKPTLLRCRRGGSRPSSVEPHLSYVLGLHLHPALSLASVGLCIKLASLRKGDEQASARHDLLRRGKWPLTVLEVVGHGLAHDGALLDNVDDGAGLSARGLGLEVVVGADGKALIVARLRLVARNVAERGEASDSGAVVGRRRAAHSHRWLQLRWDLARTLEEACDLLGTRAAQRRRELRRVDAFGLGGCLFSQLDVQARRAHDRNGGTGDGANQRHDRVEIRQRQARDERIDERGQHKVLNALVDQHGADARAAVHAHDAHHSEQHDHHVEYDRHNVLDRVLLGHVRKRARTFLPRVATTDHPGGLGVLDAHHPGGEHAERQNSEQERDHGARTARVHAHGAEGEQHGRRHGDPAHLHLDSLQHAVAVELGARHHKVNVGQQVGPQTHTAEQVRQLRPPARSTTHDDRDIEAQEAKRVVDEQPDAQPHERGRRIEGVSHHDGALPVCHVVGVGAVGLGNLKGDVGGETRQWERKDRRPCATIYAARPTNFGARGTSAEAVAADAVAYGVDQVGNKSPGSNATTDHESLKHERAPCSGV